MKALSQLSWARFTARLCTSDTAGYSSPAVPAFADGKIEAYVGPPGLGAADNLETVIVELIEGARSRLRSTIAPHRCTGYEVFWRCLKTEKTYAEIVRWNGRIGDFTSLQKLFGPQYGFQDGDVVEATIVGNGIKGFINGIEVISATDETYDAGNPGIGCNFGVADTNVDHGFTYFEVNTYND